jgi:hypothetical protein
MRFQPGDKVYVNESYSQTFMGSTWVGRPGVVKKASEYVVGEEPIAYFVHLPEWNGLPAFEDAVFRGVELDGDLDRA